MSPAPHQQPQRRPDCAMHEQQTHLTSPPGERAGFMSRSLDDVTLRAIPAARSYTKMSAPPKANSVKATVSPPTTAPNRITAGRGSSSVMTPLVASNSISAAVRPSAARVRLKTMRLAFTSARMSLSPGAPPGTALCPSGSRSSGSSPARRCRLFRVHGEVPAYVRLVLVTRAVAHHERRATHLAAVYRGHRSGGTSSDDRDGGCDQDSAEHPSLHVSSFGSGASTASTMRS